MNWKLLLSATAFAGFLAGCGGNSETQPTDTDTTQAAAAPAEDPNFVWVTEQFADLRILRYQVPGFDRLPLQKKEMLYYLYEAALSGRDMIYDQNNAHNLTIRRTLENIFQTFSGDKTTEDWTKFHTYLKRVWFSNGIHHHYSTKKFLPEFSKEYFTDLVKNSDQTKFPVREGETVDQMVARISPVMFDPKVEAKRVNKDKGVDPIAGSANNFYGDGITEKDVKAYYAGLANPEDKNPISWGLNSKLVKEKGELVEKTWRVGGMYHTALFEVTKWLEKAAAVAENDNQRKALNLLIEYYKTGDLKKWDEYCIAWVNDVNSDIDVINGFIEVYGDALGYRASYESVVQVKDPIASKRIEALSQNAQWFEDNSSIMAEHKKKNVKGITARVINVVMEAGDASPSTPVGINLPNSNWIREQHGSKSVNLANISRAYDEAGKKSGILQEFAYDEAEIKRSQEHGALAGALHTDLHEVIGHASGQINQGVGQPHETLKQYASTLEEARADLVALYYILDPKLVEIGVMPSLEVGKEEYSSYIRNGLILQLRRIEKGEDLEEDHMRNRQLIARWCMEKGAKDNVIEKKVRDGKTYFVVNDYEKLRVLFGELLREIQRLKSEGDFAAAEALVEGYGVKVDQALRDEVHRRVEALNIAPYAGFINPKLVPVMDGNGKITDVKIEYPSDFTEQHLYYSSSHSFMPSEN